MITANRFLRAAVLFALVGMVVGVAMAASHKFGLKSTHGHISLVGWTSMFLYGIFYRVIPEAGETRLATAHFYTSIVGAVAMIAGVGGLALFGPAWEPVAGFGSVVTLLSMIVFGVVVFRHTGADARSASPFPAE